MGREKKRKALPVDHETDGKRRKDNALGLDQIPHAAGSKKTTLILKGTKKNNNRGKGKIIRYPGVAKGEGKARCVR